MQRPTDDIISDIKTFIDDACDGDTREEAIRYLETQDFKDEICERVEGATEDLIYGVKCDMLPEGE